MTEARTDRNNNPTAFTVDVAKEAGLVLGTDYEVGDPFLALGRTFYTAKLLGDPVALTIRVIDAIGFRTKTNLQRWSYISIPKFLWDNLPPLLDSVGNPSKRDVIGAMYKAETGVTMRPLFPNYESDNIF
jgi:hypothetical protein